jgi:hypothetical protein
MGHNGNRGGPKIGETVSVLSVKNEIFSGEVLSIVNADEKDVGSVLAAEGYESRKPVVGQRLYIIDFRNGTLDIFLRCEINPQPPESREVFDRPKPNVRYFASPGG